MSFFGWFNRNAKANEMVSASIQATNERLDALAQALNHQSNNLVEQSNSLTTIANQTNARLDEVAQALNNRETQQKIIQAIQTGLKTHELEKILGSTCGQVEALNSVLNKSRVHPLPVQSFPLVDDFRFETQKQELASAAANQFVQAGDLFASKLAKGHEPVKAAMESFFRRIKELKEGNKSDFEKKHGLKNALNTLIDCSPKKIIANFQENALQTGWALVSAHNALIDALAKEFPRCRAGIYASRLNYADVIQISDEVLSTLRASSTLLDDAQRRHDLLEALQGEMLRDIETEEIQLLWEGVQESLKGSFKLATERDHGLSWLAKKAAEPVLAGVTLAASAVAVPTAQFQGHVARRQRFHLFVATTYMLEQVWEKWSNANEQIVKKHLEIMLLLKADYIRNKIICLCDLINANGYSLDSVSCQNLLKNDTKTI